MNQPPVEQPKEPKPFTDDQLGLIVALATDDAKVAAFIQSIEARPTVNLARAALVTGIAYHASKMLEFRKAMRETAEAALKQKAAAAIAKPPPVEAVPEAPGA